MEMRTNKTELVAGSFVGPGVLSGAECKFLRELNWPPINDWGNEVQKQKHQDNLLEGPGSFMSKLYRE